MTSTPQQVGDRNCFGCPSLLTIDQANTFFRKTIGTPVCARYGRPIGNMKSTDAQRDKIATVIAKNCSSYGDPRPSIVDWGTAEFKVALPDPVAIDRLNNNQMRNQQLVSTCSSCEWFVREDVVHGELGWSSGMCSAKGKLLLGNRYTYEAKNCDYRSFGSVRTDVGELIVLPEYAEDFTGSSDPVKRYRAEKAAGFVDPMEYPTDAPVSDEDKSHGIRAWREITDPESGNSVHLPVFDPEFFSEEERSKIPRTGDDEHPENYVDYENNAYKVAVLWMDLDETPAFWGEPGTGKTEFFRFIAWLMCAPFERISIKARTEKEDLIGTMRYSKERGTYFQYGRLPRAWSKPCVVVVDEPNTAEDPSVWHALRPLFDNSKQLVIDENDGEQIRRNEFCFMGVAMNPAWDAKNVGTNMLADADVNRLMHLYVELPPPALEREIIKARTQVDGWTIDNEKLSTIMQIAEDIRALCKEDALPITWAIRPQLKVARLSRRFDLITCYRMASADFLEPEAQEALLNCVRSNLA